MLFQVLYSIADLGERKVPQIYIYGPQKIKCWNPYAISDNIGRLDFGWRTNYEGMSS